MGLKSPRKGGTHNNTQMPSAQAGGTCQGTRGPPKAPQSPGHFAVCRAHLCAAADPHSSGRVVPFETKAQRAQGFARGDPANEKCLCVLARCPVVWHHLQPSGCPGAGFPEPHSPGLWLVKLGPSGWRCTGQGLMAHPATPVLPRGGQGCLHPLQQPGSLPVH